jgi:tetratricopeptide (TPR) repeat protein
VTPATRKGPITTRDRACAVLFAFALIVIALSAAYANSLTGKFIFDDLTSVPENPTIRHLWPLSSALTPPHGTGATVEGRPVLNLSFALNFALGGTRVQGYHIVNLAIHILACLVLFGIVRRTLARSADFLRPDALPIACVCALIFGLHPLQTESVSYIAQRAESLMGLLFLVSLYGAIRAAASDRSSWWLALSIAAACLCAGTKEVAIALPLIVLLYDRTFLAGSFAGAWRQRRSLYLGLAASWVVLACLALSTGDRGGTIGSRAGITPWDYALCQSRAIFHYLRLCFWPAPLIADYGTNFVPFSQALPWAIALLAILSAIAHALVKRPALGFLGAWFFIILAPTSSFVGGPRQMLAEHRLYLSLAAVVLGTVLLLYRYLGRRTLALGVIIAAVCAVVTAERNEAYHDSLSLYQDTVLHRPNNAWAHYDLGLSLENNGRPQEALAQYQEALRLKPDYAEAHNNLGLLLARRFGRQTDALAHYESALRLKPDYAEAHNNLGLFLARQPGRQAEAIAHFETALRLKPDDAEVHNNLANLLARLPGRQTDAIAQFETALRLKPDYAEAHYNLANLLARLPDRQADTIVHYETALRLKPDFAEAHYNLANFFASLPGRQAEAIAHFETALRLKPDFAGAHYNLANLLASLPGRQAEAIDHYETALRLKPDFAGAHNNLANLLASLPGRQAEAIAHFETALRLLPNSFVIHFNLGRVLEALPNRQAEAALHFTAALKINPAFAPAREALQRLQRHDD